MANTITAGNGTNGGTAISSDTSGTLQIKSGTGSGVVAMDIGTNGYVAYLDGAVGTPSIAHSGDLDTGIYFSAANTVDIATGGTAGVQVDSSQNLKFNSGYGSVATAYGCRAWINFDGSTTPPTINASANVTSITDNGTGDYTLNFTNAFPDNDYSAVASSGSNNSNTQGAATSVGIQTTTTLRFYTNNANTGVAVDRANISVAVFR